MSFPKMALSIVPASSLKKKQQSASQPLNFDYDIYKCQYILRVKTPNESKFLKLNK